MKEYNKNTKESTDKLTRLVKFTDFLSKRLGEVLQNPKKNLAGEIDNIFNKALKVIQNSNLSSPESQKLVFDQVVYFLNGLFKKVGIKKIYNNIPKTDIVKYENMSLGNEFIHNVYGKEWNLFYRDEVEGSGCSYRTILFKHFFDKLESMGMDIKSDIFFYNSVTEYEWGHSGVVVSFQDEDYIVDIFGFNKDKLIEKISKLKQFDDSNDFDVFNRNNIEKYYNQKGKRELDPLFFKDIGDFISKWGSIRHKYAEIELQPKIDGKDVHLEISFVRDEILVISLKVDNHIPMYFHGNDDIIQYLQKIPNEKFLDSLISKTHALKRDGINTKQQKQLLTKCINLIREKISIPNLRKIIGC